jgi:hypothetical protein
MNSISITLTVIGSVLALLFGAVWLALRIRPRPFPPYSEQAPELTTIPLPPDLPQPVLRYYKNVVGDRAPLIDTAVISGRMKLRLAGLTFPGRFRFTHVAGQDYRHYLEATLFGHPLLKVNETYLDGKARLELPGGVVENEPKIDLAANLGLWGESFWLPSIFITHPQVRWEADGDHTATLVIPYGDQEESFTVTFDPSTGLLQWAEAERYRDAKDESKIPWRLEPQGWATFHGIMIPTPAAAIWRDQGKPWVSFTIKDVAYNVDVSEYIRGSGL